MIPSLSLGDILGILTESIDGPTEEWDYSYELSRDDFDWIVSELDLAVEEEGGVRFTYDPDDDEHIGEFVEEEGVYYTDLDLDEYTEDYDPDESEDLEEASHIKGDGSLDFRKLIGKATRKYQNALIAGACFASPVSGTAGEPDMPDQSISERIVKRVNSKGKITRTQDRKTRRRKATQTTGMSPARRRQIARKASRTKKRNPMINRRALRKRKKALRKRKSMGLR